MLVPIEDYALLSNCRTAALVSRGGSIDWFCAPRLDSPSLFGAILGDAENGHWKLSPTDVEAQSTRHYDDHTFVLITRWETATGVAEVHDFLPMMRDGHAAGQRVDLVRRLVGISGSVTFKHDLRIRFDYSRSMPWMRQVGQTEPELVGVAGPDAIVLRGLAMENQGKSHHGFRTIHEGEHSDAVLTWFQSHRPVPQPLDSEHALSFTRQWWLDWAGKIQHEGPYREKVIRSLLILRALTNRDTGGIAAAATTSLPEEFGGQRNWDYRFVWLRDAALTLEALLDHGFIDVAEHWREWLLRAVAGDPSDMQIMYGMAGERDLLERELPHLPGYAGSKPVRVGNGAADQYQADVIGEVLVTLCAARSNGLGESKFSWALQRHFLDYTARQRHQPDHGLWEIRGEPRMFTHSRVMIWAAFDRGVRAVEEHGLHGPVDKWRELRDQMHEEIRTHGIGSHGGFTQHYGTDEVDASLLLLPQVGFCLPTDPAMLATVAQVEKYLIHDGLVRRYRNSTGVDGLTGEEYPFLVCSFWLVEQYAAVGRADEALELMDRLCALTNDVGMLSEEYDVKGRRQAGNTPQAFSHLGLVRAADALTRHSCKPR